MATKTPLKTQPARRPARGGLARRIKPLARWEDLVLPQRQVRTLRQVVAEASRSSAAGNMGPVALFAGPDRAGKLRAAEVIARALTLDLYRVDLRRVVGKYIGETEKNLAHIFDTGDSGTTVLLLDEADALFGKRSEVKDAHDRYSAIAASRLLRRLERHRGLAVVMSESIDTPDEALLRRFRFVVRFPKPRPIPAKRPE